MNSVAMNFHVPIFENKLKIGVFNSLGEIPRRRIARSYGNSMSQFVRNCQTVFYSG